MKETESADSIDISKTVPFDETAYITSGDDMPPVLSYIYKLKDYYNTNYGYDFTKIFYVSVKKRKELGIFMGSLPYQVISLQRHSEIPDAKRHKISLSLASSGIYDTGATYAVQKTYPEIAGQKITLSYVLATQADQATIDSYGGLLSTPAYLINVKPEIRLNDVTILTGPEVGLGAPMSITTALSSPNMSTDIKATDITQGISYAIGLPALTYAGTQLIGQIDRMRVLEGTLHDSISAMDTRAGELLQNIAIEYFGQLNNISRSVEGVMHVQLTKMPSIAFVSADATYNEVFGTPVSPPIMQGLGIDARRVASLPMPIDGDLAQRKAFIKQRGLNSSYLEHKILENLFGIESISAVKALQTAATNNIPIYVINSGNIGSMLPLLTLSQSDKTDIQNAVNAGKEVTVSRDNITLYDWTGVGYIVRDPTTGTGSYMISNGLGGGGTAQVAASNPAFDGEIKLAWFITGQQMFLSEHPVLWNWLEEVVTATAVLPIWQYYGYIPMDYSGADETWVKLAANHEWTWIFYYAGHGAYGPAIPDAICPKNCVRPSDIQSNAKIVFLNSCGSMNDNNTSDGSFVDSFHIDGSYTVGGKQVHRNEAILGFAGDSVLFFSEWFAFEYWLLMGQGLSTEEARLVLIARAATTPALSTAYHLLQLRVENAPKSERTTLVP